jgi:hypothetical protein
MTPPLVTRKRLGIIALAVILATVAIVVIARRGGGDPGASETASTSAGRDLPTRDREARGEVATDGGVRRPRTPLDDTVGSWPAAELSGRGRHGWKLDDLLGDRYWEPQKEVHVHTADGLDFVVRGDGHAGDDVILVERDDGTRYVGWLVPGADPDGDLGDIEQPAARIEDVVDVTIQDQPKDPEMTPATLEVAIDGSVVRTLGADELAGIATAQMPAKDGTMIAALDLTRDLGGTTELVTFVANGSQVEGTPPASGVKPVLHVNRRKRFKLAWLDATGKPVEGTKFREVSRIDLRRR